MVTNFMLILCSKKIFHTSVCQKENIIVLNHTKSVRLFEKKGIEKFGLHIVRRIRKICWRKFFIKNMSVNEMVGWELLYKLIERDVKTESDIIVAITHWYLINQAGFRCLGTGDEVRVCLT